ncbi:hypothetical protein [Candidatus Erwinia dacicola]|uniref:hypothetical protein n=1 Tax=Candidatus Erwinia dacicola TaxID=252393 RepID=UPI00139240A4|nr:hypothetical protein [Candidatus Erwinia dacicola]
MLKRSRNRRETVNNKEKTDPSKGISKNSDFVTGTKEAKSSTFSLRTKTVNKEINQLRRTR